VSAITRRERRWDHPSAQRADAPARRPEGPAPSSPPSLGHALEHVVEAGQELIVRRVDLQAERVVERGRVAFARSLVGAAGGIVAVGGWFLFLAGAITLLSDHFPRTAVEMAIGLAHVALGAVLVLYSRRRAAEETPR